MENQSQQKQVTVVVNQKSMGLAILLSLLFGPLGMLYSTITGAIVMLLVNILVAIFTVGFGLLFTWPICVVWAAIATNNHNKKLSQL
jgi:hypothetical protein